MPQEPETLNPFLHFGLRRVFFRAADEDWGLRGLKKAMFEIIQARTQDLLEV